MAQKAKFNFRTFNKTQHRILVERMEHYYAHLLYHRDLLHNGSIERTKTDLELKDRKLRLKLKSCETLLISLGSKLFEHVESTNFRKTRTINARMDGAA